LINNNRKKRRFRKYSKQKRKRVLIHKAIISILDFIYLVNDKRGNLAAPSLATYVNPSSTVVKFHI
jgi:hypothetical protein